MNDSGLTTPLLDAALTYASRGWSIVPVKPGEKRPALDWMEYQSRRASEDQIREWCADPKLTAIALVLGPISGGVYVRDFDVADAYREWLEAFSSHSTAMPTVKTGKGAHVYARLPADCQMSGIEVYRDGELRLSGGIVVLPPSLHPSGGRYQWIIPLAAALPEIDPREIGLVGLAPIKRKLKFTDIPELIPEHSRNNVLTSLAGTMRRRGMAAEEIRAALLTANATRCRPPLPDAEVNAIVDSVAKYEPTAAPKTRVTEPIVIRMADIAPENIYWLWHPFIPRGKLTILEGDPGVGKTTLAIQLASIVTRGWAFPSVNGTPGAERQKAAVVYLNAEDGIADTLRPRLDRADADVNRVYVVTGVRIREGAKVQDRAITLQDVAELETVLTDYQPELLVVDPIQAYMGPKIDINKANETRPVLAALASLAERHQCAVLCIRHLGKARHIKSLYQGLGSIDFSAAARSVLLAARDKENPQQRILAHVKCSVAAEGKSIGYEITDGFYWTGVLEVTAENLNEPDVTERESVGIDKAREFLESVLSTEPIVAKEIESKARRKNISTWGLRKARVAMGVVTRKIDGQYTWSLPATMRSYLPF